MFHCEADKNLALARRNGGSNYDSYKVGMFHCKTAGVTYTLFRLFVLRKTQSCDSCILAVVAASQKSKKATTPGIPRRSPIQVLTWRDRA